MELAKIKTLVDTAVSEAFGKIEDAPTVEVGYAEPERGDFYTNAPFLYARTLKQSPQDLAAKLAKALSHEAFGKVEPVGGYVNLSLKAEAWGGELSKLGEWLEPAASTGKKVQVEFISANPTGPTTFGNARGGFIGDVIASVLATQGHEVVREYYFNDSGTQISKLVESVKASAGLIQPAEVQYSGEYVQELADEFSSQLREMTDAEIGELLTQTILKRYVEPAVAKMHVKYDVWFNEKTLGPDGKTAAAFAALRAQDLIYEQDGATWLASIKLGDDRDRVLIKSSGDMTYLANDIAYHWDIFANRGFDRAIKDWGADHAAQVPSLRLVMQALAPQAQLDFVIHQWVRLIRDGKEVKISKRAGTYVTVEEVIDEVGSDVARFFFLMRSADSQMDFDLDLAREQSQKNPLYYVMYSYARTNSILSQAAEQGLAAGGELAEPNKLERRLIIQMSRWPQLLAQIASDYGVHRLTFYGIELAGSLHDYYESEKIIGLDPAVAQSKLYLLQQYKLFLEAYFKVLGITPVAKMTTQA